MHTWHEGHVDECIKNFINRDGTIEINFLKNIMILTGYLKCAVLDSKEDGGTVTTFMPPKKYFEYMRELLKENSENSEMYTEELENFIVSLDKEIGSSWPMGSCIQTSRLPALNCMVLTVKLLPWYTIKMKQQEDEEDVMLIEYIAQEAAGGNLYEPPGVEKYATTEALVMLKDNNGEPIEGKYKKVNYTYMHLLAASENFMLFFDKFKEIFKDYYLTLFDVCDIYVPDTLSDSAVADIPHNAVSLSGNFYLFDNFFFKASHALAKPVYRKCEYTVIKKLFIEELEKLNFTGIYKLFYEKVFSIAEAFNKNFFNTIALRAFNSLNENYISLFIANRLVVGDTKRRKYSLLKLGHFIQCDNLFTEIYSLRFAGYILYSKEKRFLSVKETEAEIQKYLSNDNLLSEKIKETMENINILNEITQIT